MNRPRKLSAANSPIGAEETVHFFAFWMLAGITAVMCGCNPPVLDDAKSSASRNSTEASRPASASVGGMPGDPAVQIFLHGDGFTDNSRLVVDGFVDGNKDPTLQTVDLYYVSVASLTFTDSQNLSAVLTIKPDAPPGTYLLAVGVPMEGISRSKPFLVSCSGCPPPPFLQDFVNLLTGAFYRGNMYDVRFDGLGLDNNPSLSVSGAGVTFGPISNVQSDSIAATMTVAPDAETGLHEVLVTTTGGTSNRLLLPIYGAPVTAPVIASITPNCVPPGVLTALTITGSNFEVGMDIEANQPNIQVSEITFVNQNTYTAKVLVPGALPPGLFGLQLRGVNAASNVFNLSQPCSQNGPLLSLIKPSEVTKGSLVFLKCEGLGFISGDSKNGNIVVDEATGVTVFPSLRPIEANASQVVVTELLIGSGAGSSGKVSVQNTFTGLFSNQLPLTISDPVAGRPFISSLSSSTPPGVIRGGDADFVISGSNLQNVTGIVASVPGVTFSQLTVTPGGQVQVHVHADATAPLSADDATNFSVSSPTGPSNLFVLPINPP